MKKIFTLILSCALLFTLAACGNSTAENENSSQNISPSAMPQTDSPPQGTAGTQTDSKSLVVYFSWSGNTETIAKEIASQTGSDIFQITPVNSYSTDYDTVVDFAKQEQRDNARPEIAGTIGNFSEYDVIYMGFPNWWGDMPMIMYTFLDTYDLSGKTLAPFVSSGGSGFSNTISSMKEAEPNATITEGLSLSSSASKNPSGAVTDWLAEIGLNK